MKKVDNKVNKVRRKDMFTVKQAYQYSTDKKHAVKDDIQDLYAGRQEDVSFGSGPIQEKSNSMLALPEKDAENKIYFMLNIVARSALRQNIPKAVLERYSGACLITIDFQRKELKLNY